MKKSLNRTNFLGFCIRTLNSIGEGDVVFLGEIEHTTAVCSELHSPFD
jgi:hypothetical protein